MPERRGRGRLRATGYGGLSRTDCSLAVALNLAVACSPLARLQRARCYSASSLGPGSMNDRARPMKAGNGERIT